MDTYSKPQLEAMGLSPLRENIDEGLKYGEWDRRGVLHAAIRATVPNGNTNGTDKPLPDEYYLCKKETGVWTLKYLTSAEGNHKSNAHLIQASNSDNYSVSTYNEYIPTVVMDAVDAYIFI